MTEPALHLGSRPTSGDSCEAEASESTEKVIENDSEFRLSCPSENQSRGSCLRSHDDETVVTAFCAAKTKTSPSPQGTHTVSRVSMRHGCPSAGSPSRHVAQRVPNHTFSIRNILGDASLSMSDSVTCKDRFCCPYPEVTEASAQPSSRSPEAPNNTNVNPPPDANCHSGK